MCSSRHPRNETPSSQLVLLINSNNSHLLSNYLTFSYRYYLEIYFWFLKFVGPNLITSFVSGHPDEFRFTRQGNAPYIDNVDDSETFYEMSEGLFNLGITEEQQLFLFSVLAAILHMGNIKFNEERNDSCSINVSWKCYT